MANRTPKSNLAPGSVVLSEPRYRRLLNDVKTLLNKASRAEDKNRVAAHSGDAKWS